jgi:hypothetical protein
MEGDKKSKFVTISIEKDVYFGNTDIKGEVTFGEPPKPTTLKTVMIILWARYIEYPRNGGPRESMSLHMSRRPVAQEMELIPGEEPKVVPFQFTIPSDVPSSIMTPLGAVQWRIAVVNEITSGRGMTTQVAVTPLCPQSSISTFVCWRHKSLNLICNGTMSLVQSGRLGSFASLFPFLLL